jgi:predicted transcriptional regulator
MAKKTKTRKIEITASQTPLGIFFKILGTKKREYDFSGISVLRQILNNEKARILHTIKNESPNSIYHLAKILGRDFKSVREDVALLEKFGFIDLIEEKKGNREMLKPILVVDAINITINV